MNGTWKQETGDLKGCKILKPKQIKNQNKKEHK